MLQKCFMLVTRRIHPSQVWALSCINMIVLLNVILGFSNQGSSADGTFKVFITGNKFLVIFLHTSKVHRIIPLEPYGSPKCFIW